ncbi:hypothetical protein QMO23_25895, partial [Klebsiella pneumoniae]|nr:hypothetical protein [Klebsiella pneumoniae]
EDGAGAALAMVNAIRDAGIEPGQIGYVNAHGTSTPAGDKAEAQAVKSVFGDAASRVLVSSTKSMTGHLLGAAGAGEAIFSIPLSFTHLPAHETGRKIGCRLLFLKKKNCYNT